MSEIQPIPSEQPHVGADQPATSDAAASSEAAVNPKATSYNKARLKIMWPFGIAMVVGATEPIFTLDQPVYAQAVRWVGFALLMLGVFIRLWCLGHLRKKERLSVSGPYAHSRNPLYVGTFFILLGALLTANWWLGLALLIPYLFTFHYVYSRQIEWEEFRLTPIFGQDYQDYLDGAPRFWPSMKPYAKRDADQRFSFGLLLKNHAHDLVLGTLALLLAMDFMSGVIWPVVLNGADFMNQLELHYAGMRLFVGV